MNVVIALNILAVLLAYLDSIKIYKHGLKIAFFLIFLFLALRYDYGNDYRGYLEGFYTINQYSWIDYFNLPEEIHFEAGWIFLNRIFEPLGFFAMVAFLAAVNSFIFYRFIKKYVPREYYWFATFLYVFTPEFMLIHSSAMRQTLAISVGLLSFDYICKQKYLYIILMIFFASVFHKSALILIPIYLSILFEWKINTQMAIFILLSFILLFLLSENIHLVLKQIIYNFASFERYNVYLDIEGTIGSGAGILFSSFLFITILFYAKRQSGEQELAAKLAMLYYLSIPISLAVMMFTRISFYIQPFIIVAISTALIESRNNFLKTFLMSFVVLTTTFLFYRFFQSEIWSAMFSNYKTILSSPVFR